MLFLDYIWVIPLLPALGAAVMFFFGRKLQKATVNTVCVGTIVLAFIMACGSVLEYTAWADAHNHQPYQTILYTWLGSDAGHLNYLTHDGAQAPFQADAGFLLDPLSSIWLLFVTGVGMLIHIYSIGYMAHEGGYYRFFGYLNLFMFAMLTLILANNYVLMFVGWEGVGLCSYLLIGFYFHRKSASDAANKAFIVNRIGDAGFILGMFFIAWLCGSLRFVDVNAFARLGTHSPETLKYITAATLLLFVGACGKSAQLPLYIWLPDAMEGPTPVSALIHAATMVTAGVYMVARSNALFVLAPTSMKTVAIVGALTAIFAASIGLVQNDIKRVLAYSTVSQLGYMFLALGVGAFAAGVFHVFTHAFFKALLFLGAGSVIHAMSGEQDMRNMGALAKRIPTTYWTMLIATLAISGIPPFAGFFSKDEILWQTWANEGDDYRILW
jgi:NADH-quinone oxidoreductase subunit L